MGPQPNRQVNVDFVGAIEGDLDAATHIARQAIGYWALVDEVDAMARKSSSRAKRRKRRVLPR